MSSLSINSFQKDIAGTNQLIRGLALRVPDIIQIQLLAVRKCATDSSPYVRQCAATQILEKLLKDASTTVLGSAIAAFNEICPISYEVLHRGYRKICHLLADMDEWTQVSVLEVMTRYVRNQLTDPASGVAAAVRLRAKRRSRSAVKGRNTVKRRVVRNAFYSDEEDESEEEEVVVEEVKTRATRDRLRGRDLDRGGSGPRSQTHTAILTTTSEQGTRPHPPQSKRDAVCGMTGEVPSFPAGLFRRRHCSRVQQTAQSGDPECSKNVRPTFDTATMGRIADALPKITDRCMDGIMHLIYYNKAPDVMVEAVVGLRQMLQQAGNTEYGSLILHGLLGALAPDGSLMKNQDEGTDTEPGDEAESATVQ
eukprot:gene10033-20894_t